MDPAKPSEDLDRIRRERDLYRRLLDLGGLTELEPFLREALDLVVGLTGAQQAYIELRDELTGEDDEPWSMASGCSDEDVETIRSRISRGIIAEALATGETVVTQSALLDKRFSELASVKIGKIEAVLCAPVGRLGAVYLQGRTEPGPFTDADVADTEMLALHLNPLASGLILRRRAADSEDATHALRARYQLDEIVGRSPALAAALEQAMLAAPLDVNVLLTGESGTGKSHIAQAIHQNSPRASGPFVGLNCAALPEQLIESELFGALAGSHSTATRDAPGKVGAAEGGTLFLDEVAEIPYEAQAKLLQLLQSREYYPLGATEPRHANVRLIAATNADLSEAVKERRFREDLFFRLQVLPVHVPSLRERREDLGGLAEALCRRCCKRHHFPALSLSPGAVRAIEAASWPGNVRELENAIEVASIKAMGENAERIEARHVFGDGAEDAAPDDGPITYHAATRAFQKELLERTLRETDWNVAETARRLDLARSRVYTLIDEFGLSRSQHGKTGS